MFLNGAKGAERSEQMPSGFHLNSLKIPFRYCLFCYYQYYEIGSSIKHLWRTILIFMRMSEMIGVCVCAMMNGKPSDAMGIKQYTHVAAKEKKNNL